MSDETRVVEVNGVRVEVDLRTAKATRVNLFRVGDRVRVLVKEYSDKWIPYHGVIVAFDDFENLPTITVGYINDSYTPELKFAYINEQSKGLELLPCDDDVLVNKGNVVARLNAEIDKKQAEKEDIEHKRDFFLTRFGAWFKDETSATDE